MRPPPPSPTLSAPSRSDEVDRNDALEAEVDRNDALEAFLGALAGDDPERLYDQAPCGYLTTTSDGLIAKVNQTFLTLTGYEQGDLIGRRRFVDLLTGGGRIYHETHYAPMLQMQGRAREIALDLVCSDGRRLPVLVNSVLERDSSGLPMVIRTAVFDATQRREYERELLRAKQRAEASEARARTLAQTLQQSFIPPARPQIPGLVLAGAYRPAGDGAEIGGDFYDVFEVSASDWCVVIGDVCGKGVEALWWWPRLPVTPSGRPPSASSDPPAASAPSTKCSFTTTPNASAPLLSCDSATKPEAGPRPSAVAVTRFPS